MMDPSTRRLQVATMALELALPYMPDGLRATVAIMLSEIFEEWDDRTAETAGVQAAAQAVGPVSGVWLGLDEEGSQTTTEGEARLVDVFGLPERR